MLSLYQYIKRGLSREKPRDPIAAATEDRRGSTANIRILFPYLGRHWRKAAAAVVLFLLVSALSLPMPLISRYLIDDVILGRRMDLLFWALSLLIGTALLGRIMGLLRHFSFMRLEQTIVLDIQQDLFRRVLHFPKSFFDDKETGYLMSRVSSDIHGVRWFFSWAIVQIMENILRFVGGVGFLLYLEWKLTLAVLLVIPGSVLLVRCFSKRLHALGHESMEQQAKITSRFQEALSSISLIKAFSTEDRTVHGLMSELRKAFHLSLEQMTISSLANLAVSSMPELSRAIVLAVGACWVIDGRWTLGSLFAFQSYLGFVYGPVQVLTGANLQVQNALASLDRVSALFRLGQEENVGTGKIAGRLTGEVELQDVSFTYNGQEMVLEEVSFHIHPGEHVGIVGPSGVGKTTLISLLLLFYGPSRGRIFFDGIPASQYDVKSLRRRIGYVSQSTLLMSGSFMENLLYGNPDATADEVLQAAKIAEIHDFIERLPEGYETHIGERGVNLSEGQKQRMALARALVRDPDILVLDEPTSSLDSSTEMSIFSALPHCVRKKTMFVAAHRLSTIRNSDRILLLNENRLAAVGTHRSLLETNEYYRKAVGYQQ